jgi:hypothetical protein
MPININRETINRETISRPRYERPDTRYLPQDAL